MSPERRRAVSKRFDRISLALWLGVNGDPWHGRAASLHGMVTTLPMRDWGSPRWFLYQTAGPILTKPPRPRPIGEKRQGLPPRPHSGTHPKWSSDCFWMRSGQSGHTTEPSLTPGDHRGVGGPERAGRYIMTSFSYGSCGDPIDLAAPASTWPCLSYSCHLPPTWSPVRTSGSTAAG